MNNSATPRRRWDVISVFASTGLVALVAAPIYLIANPVNLWFWLVFAVFLMWNGLSITAGYHRLWSHKAYQTRTLVRVLFALGGALAIQNSIKVWSSNHRHHHQFTDDVDHDPYSAKKGLFFSHIGWMLRDYPASATDFSNVRDLGKDWVVTWQHDNYWTLVVVMNVLVPLALGGLMGDALAGWLLFGFVRLVICHHTTFFINSLAHFWGSQPYSDEHTARDNGILALLTYGEGYHNFHHTFQWDYRNGIRWYHFDPTKWLINLLAWFKLASNLKVAAPEKIEMSRARMQLKQATQTVSRLKTINADKWRALLEDEYEHLIQSINRWSQCRQEWVELKKANLKKRWEETELELASKLATLEEELNIQRRQWQMLTQQFA